ncbi:zinc finger MYM-type protein 1 [Tanacetum coccineum]
MKSHLDAALKNSERSDVDANDLYMELRLLSNYLPNKNLGPVDILNFLKEHDVFPNAMIAYRVLLAIPVTVASAERSFSKLKLVGSLLEWVFNSLVHSLRALSTLRRSGLRTDSTAMKPYQGDSLEFYLITSRIPDDLQHSFRNSDACYHDPEKCEHAGPKVTTIHGGNTTTRMIKRFTVADDLKESSKITQVKGTKFKDHYIMYKEINA